MGRMADRDAHPEHSAHGTAAEEVVQLCSDLIQIDTTNYGDADGPGERKAAEHVVGLLDEVGIEASIHESEPGRASVLARWGGDVGDPLLIHGHLDVVPAEADDWQVHPFSGDVRDGMVWGRGAVDMKDFDAMLLAVVRERQRAGRVPDRPVLLAFTADEEAGGHKGAEYLIEEHRDFFDGATEAVGEVGGFSATIRGRRLYLIETAEKGMAWMRLTAKGTAGHGSMRHPDNAVTALTAAVARVGAYEWPVKLTPTMETLLGVVAEIAGTSVTPENVEDLVAEFGSAARMVGAVIKNTTNPTMLDAGYKVNVIPQTASASVDGRFLPGERDSFLATMEDLVGEDIEIGFHSLQDPLETSFDGRIVDGIKTAIAAEDPDALVAPYVMSGGTDGKHFNKLGMRCFGFAPLRLPEDLDFTGLFHGIDERVPVDALEFGTRVFDRFLDEVACEKE